MFVVTRRSPAAVLAAFAALLVTQGLVAWFAAPIQPERAAAPALEAAAPPAAGAKPHPWVSLRDCAPLLWRS